VGSPKGMVVIVIGKMNLSRRIYFKARRE